MHRVSRDFPSHEQTHLSICIQFCSERADASIHIDSLWDSLGRKLSLTRFQTVKLAYRLSDGYLEFNQV